MHSQSTDRLCVVLFCAVLSFALVTHANQNACIYLLGSPDWGRWENLVIVVMGPTPSLPLGDGDGDSDDDFSR